MQRWMWLVGASITYVLAFWFPDWLWWLVFLYPVGIIVTGVQSGIPWYIAYLWGYVTYLLHSFGLYYALIYMADGPIVPRLIPSLIISMYMAIFPAVAFGIATYVQRDMTNKLARTGVWFVALIALTWIIDTSSLAILGVWEGYPFMHPTVPVASVPRLLSLLPMIGKFGYTILIYLVSTAIAYAILSPRKHHLMWILITLFPWLISFYVQVNCERIPSEQTIQRCTVVPLLFPRTMDLNAILDTIQSTMQEAYSEYPETRTFILPESAFHRGDMQTYTNTLPTAQADNRVIYGAFAWEDCYYNSLFAVHNGEVTYQFRKRHALPLSERIPSLLNVSWVRNQYCAQEPEITASHNQRTPLTVIDGVTCIPYICSELFMRNTPDDAYPSYPILFVGNDVWLRHTMSQYIGDLMLNQARIQAIQWYRPIWYITYKHAYYITTCGTLIPLQVFA